MDEAIILLPVGFFAAVSMAALWAFAAKRAAASPAWQVIVAAGTAAIWFSYCALVIWLCTR